MINYVYKWGTFELFKGVQNGEVFVYKGREYIKVNLRHVNYKPVNFEVKIIVNLFTYQLLYLKVELTKQKTFQSYRC